MTIQELEEAISLYGKDVYSFCLHITTNKMLADELYQDTFLKATEQKHRLKRDGNIKSYLLSVALRLWKNQKRKFAWRKRIVPEDELIEEKEESVSASTGDVLQEYLLKEQKKVVEQAVARLEEKYKLPILLYYMEGLSIAEIADILGVPQGTVKSRLSTARKHLESGLEGYFYE
ncbi:RNA polymerase sigma factor [Anaerosporobacter faecicola]|uniref:RNA polymerase sigma factor n=1 Tax=Anaerosporobacter faecicola TaxID=2718714 RepID=UPI0014395723|nr:RNA polymerase sigma factor [Anaerosporobacter faecicola]